MLVLLLVAAPLSGVVPSAPAGASGTTLTQVRQIAAGANHTCALLDSGAIRCWGGNDQGQLGDGTFTQSSTPVRVVGVSNAVAINP